MKKALSVACIVAAMTLTSACGGGGGDDRPSKSEVKKAITAKDSVVGTVPDAAADCVAGLLVDSKLSDKTLNAIVDSDEDYDGTKADEKALTDLTTDITSCAK